MSAQHAARWSRRQFLGGLTLAGTAGLLGLRSRPVAAEPPPETTTIRLVQIPVIFIAPMYVAEELLQSEGFTDHAVWDFAATPPIFAFPDCQSGSVASLAKTSTHLSTTSFGSPGGPISAVQPTIFAMSG